MSYLVEPLRVMCKACISVAINYIERGIKMKFNAEACRMGRPPIFATAEDMALKIAKYFDEGCKTTRTGKMGEPVEMHVPTYTGLAHYLGYASRQSLYDQMRRGEDFSYTINTALTFIEQQYEENLHVGEATTGSIFVLKCRAGWIEEEKKQDANADSKKPKFQVSIG